MRFFLRGRWGTAASQLSPRYGQGRSPQRMGKNSGDAGNHALATSKIEVARSSDIAYETGAYELTTTEAKKQPVISTGKYVLVWKKQDDGKWKIAEDIENADK